MVIIMLGAPGTGKGTIGKILSKGLDIAHVSSGEMFRSYLKSQEELGKEIETYMSQGKLVPDELTIKLVDMRMQEADVKNGVILDGYPRTISQAKALKESLKKQGKRVHIAVNLSLSDEDAINRIVKRVICSNPGCEEIYNTEFRPPRKEGVCDKCGSDLTVRNDDSEEVVAKRLKSYHEYSEKLIEFYEEEGLLYTAKINPHSNNSSEEIAIELEEYLKKEQN